MSITIKEIVKQIEGLSVVELVNLFEELKGVFQITDDMLTVGSGSSSKSSDNEEEAAPAVDPNKKVAVVLGGLPSEVTKVSFLTAMRKVLPQLAMADVTTMFTSVTGGTAVTLKSDITRKEATEFVEAMKVALPGATLSIN